ncbi:MAG: TrpB-like pyridoxal phosphate-dependent enzyme [Deltaproteobacteria bacterium]|nr:TrpB-like pyridoxal phosphate-dependent enzyme [Deltaproteobacteria bacterium]MBW2015905.1 TrpB-like pyridoxal phosphate-dependent enzyme [Deltaproteobacteria bacterium]MBW2127981.1 TrpB-like pyridoxal phosphate-dependent enzyme [Deltaproteobacteria bacterium]MBW2303614.1 TrpB-like pyridoxal phosphate-dependent enzyme [Deltaproteobacteria bacterium]
MDRKKIFLPESEIPRQWYNILADMPTPMEPPLHPGTGEPIGPEDLSPIFPMPLIEQEVSTQRWIDIPEEVLEKYMLWRPSPLYRAFNLEKYLDTPARIYFKNEGVSPAGSHKPNTALAQAYYNKISGTKRITTETGAGQWGSALSMCCALFGLECKVFMVKISYNQKPYRRIMMETWGANCVPSPSPETKAGQMILSENPESPGSLGIAISEAVELAVQDDEAKYSLGSVLNHVMLHQTIIGLEAQKQMAIAGDYPDVVIGCAGGGSNFAGISFPFLRDKINGKDIDVIAVEPTSCPTMTKGPFAYDFGDTVQMTPLLPMHTLGHSFVPAPIHAGGLRYHGMAPTVSQLIMDGLIRPEAIPQLETFQAGITFARTEGFISAPETDHAVAMVIREALKAKEEGKEKVILFNWSGHGLVDMAAYEAYLRGKLADHALPEDEIHRALNDIEPLPKPKQFKKGTI